MLPDGLESNQIVLIKRLLSYFILVPSYTEMFKPNVSVKRVYLRI